MLFTALCVFHIAPVKTSVISNSTSLPNCKGSENRQPNNQRLLYYAGVCAVREGDGVVPTSDEMTNS